MKQITNEDLYAAIIVMIEKFIIAENAKEGRHLIGNYNSDINRMIEAKKNQLFNS